MTASSFEKILDIHVYKTVSLVGQLNIVQEMFYLESMACFGSSFSAISFLIPLRGTERDMAVSDIR